MILSHTPFGPAWENNIALRDTTMTIAQAQAAVYATGTVPDGYAGKITEVGFAFDPSTGNTLVVAECGYFNSVLPPAVDAKESEWLLRHHPSARIYTLN